MKNKLLPINLQFFAEGDEPDVEIDDGGNDPVDTAEPEGELEEPEEDGEPEGEPQDSDTNAQFAAARRRAEAEFKAELERRDAEYARRFKDVVNPITGLPIKSEKDYFEALDAQETLRLNEQVQSAGIDPSVIEQMIARSPMVAQANMILETQRRNEADRLIAEGVAEISKIDPDIKSLQDIPQEQMPRLTEMVRSGLSLVDAYKAENFDKLLAKSVESGKSAAAQRAINNAKSKSHLNTGSGASNNDTLVEIPDSQYAHFRSAFPDDTPEQLKQRYNSVL